MMLEHNEENIDILSGIIATNMSRDELEKFVTKSKTTQELQDLVYNNFIYELEELNIFKKYSKIYSGYKIK